MTRKSGGKQIAYMKGTGEATLARENLQDLFA
jgi:hypothetical protein